MLPIRLRDTVGSLRRFAAHSAIGEAFIALAGAAALMLSLVPVASWADTQGISAPPAEQYTVSPGGVDMRTGRYATRETDLSAGDAAADKGLVLERIEEAGLPGHVSPFGNMAHNWDITLTERRLNLITGVSGATGPTDFEVYVNIGGRLETFQAMNLTYDFQQMSRSPSAHLSQTGTRGAGGEVYTYVATDGTTITFRPLGLIGSSDCSDTVRCAYVSDMLLPDGTHYTFQYDVRTGNGSLARLASVTSNRGYELLFEHNGPDWNLVTKACLFNTAVVPAGSSCATGTLAVTSYSYTSFGGKNRLSAIVDNRSKTWSFTYATDSSCTNCYLMSYFRPGETAAWLVNHNAPNQNYFLVNEDITTSQHYADGSSWSYGYDYSPVQFNVPLGQAAQELAGGYFQNGLGQRTVVKFDFPLVPHSLQSPAIAPSPGQILFWLLAQESKSQSYSLTYVNTTTDGHGNTTDNYTESSYQSSGGLDFVNIMATLQFQSEASCNDCSSASPFQYIDSYQVTPGPITVTDPLNRTTSFDYCDKTVVSPDPGSYNCIVIGLVQSSTDPEGNQTLYKYLNNDVIERRRVAKPGSGLPDIVETATYPSGCLTLVICHKPLTVTDGNNNTTTYTYDSSHGGVLTETAPADSHGVQAVKRYSYVQRYAWVSNGSGGYVHAAAPVWLLASEKTCRTSATSSGACAAGVNDEVTTSYEYGPDTGAVANNLLLRGIAVTAYDPVAAGLVVHRTCYGYDVAGNRIAETTPRGTASMTVCP